jgi:hypothetical protein
MNKIQKILLYGTLALSTTYGTFRNTTAIPPIITGTQGKSGGICASLGAGTEKNSSFYGALVGFLTINIGELNGLSLSVCNLSSETNSRINGLQLKLADFLVDPTNDLPSRVNGIQIGINNKARNDSRGLQVGLYNQIYDSDRNVTRRTIGLNIMEGH